MVLKAKNSCRLILLAVLFAAGPKFMLRAANAANPPPARPGEIRTRAEAIARPLTHFATEAIVNNRPFYRHGIPAPLLADQARLYSEMAALSGEPEALRQLLKDEDPKIRTIALGALFVREDPRDLPFIAERLADPAPTFPGLHEPMSSSYGPHPLGELENTQTVGAVARSMILFYLNAAQLKDGRWRNDQEIAPADNVGTAFQKYWAERKERASCASWHLAKLMRATRRTSPLQAVYGADLKRVLDGIAALPRPERDWTLLYAVFGEGLPDPTEVVSEATLLQAARDIGRESLMRFLLLQPFSTDPDLRFTAETDDPRGEIFRNVSRFVLHHARDLLQNEDAIALREAAENPMQRWHGATAAWLAAASEILGVSQPVEAARQLKADFARFPPTQILHQEEQAKLAFALWRVRGAAEKGFLVDWFYAVLPTTKGVGEFLRAIEREAHRDTRELLAALMADERFSQTNWEVLAQLLQFGGTPLVGREEIYDRDPRRMPANQPAALAAWRNVLRRHYGVTEIAVSAPPATANRILAGPAQVSALTALANHISLSNDGRFIAVMERPRARDSSASVTIEVFDATTLQARWQIPAPPRSSWLIQAFADESPHKLLLGNRERAYDADIENKKLTSRPKLPGGYGDQHASVAFDRKTSRVVISGVGQFSCHDIQTAIRLWALPGDDAPGVGGLAAISPDGSMAAAAGGSNWGQRVRVLDGKTGKTLRQFDGHSSPIAGLAFAANGRILFTATGADGVRAWDMASGKLLRTYLFGGTIPTWLTSRTPLVISPDGRWLALYALFEPQPPRTVSEHRIGIFDIETGELRWEIRHPSGATSFAFAPNGNELFLAAHEAKLERWKLE